MRIKSYLSLSLASLLLLSGCATVKEDMGKKEVLCPFTGVVAGGAVGAGVSSAGLLAPAGALVGGLLADHLCGNEAADQDGDSVADSQDLCPGTLTGLAVDSEGCPLDSDSDGVIDGKDQCPGTPEGALVDTTGCVKQAEVDAVAAFLAQCGSYVTLESGQLISAKPVLFEFASAQVSDDGKKVLECLAKAAPLTQGVIQVSGHTDWVGTEAANNRLSKLRADNVYAILLEQGVDKSKLEVAAFGKAKPIADNGTKSGRAQNRRVEFTSAN